MDVQNKNGIGNPHHDDSSGRFTSGSGGASSSKLDSLFGVDSGEKYGSITCVPKNTSAGEKRRFVSDLSDEEKETIIRNYKEKFKEKLEQIEKNAVNPTIFITDASRIEDRKKWINEVIEEQKTRDTKMYGRKAYICLGLPGSGKSTIADPICRQFGAFIVDADEMKKKIPEYQQDPNNIKKVHTESVEMADDMTNELMSQGANMCIGKVGGWSQSIKDIVKKLSKSGYEVNLVMNDVPYNVSLERNEKRFETGKSDRLVPIDVIMNDDGNVFDTYDEVIKMDEVRGGMIFSNDVLLGQKPKLLRSDKETEELFL